MLREVHGKDMLELIKKAFESTFKGKDPFKKVFTDNIDECILLCPLDGYFLNEHQYKGLLSAVRNVGDRGFYISEVEVEPDCFSQGLHWECDLLTTYEEYRGLPIYLENAIFSPEAKWGLLISHEEHAIIGGEKRFIEKFKGNYPDWQSGYNRFLEKWERNSIRYKSDVEWIADFLEQFKY